MLNIQVLTHAHLVYIIVALHGHGKKMQCGGKNFYFRRNVASNNNVSEEARHQGRHDNKYTETSVDTILSMVNSWLESLFHFHFNSEAWFHL